MHGNVCLATNRRNEVEVYISYILVKDREEHLHVMGKSTRINTHPNILSLYGKGLKLHKGGSPELRIEG